ncbi:MAG: NAD/FAD-binding protein, partial [Pseudomonadota bacterium]|nr:NAD/FAD-binding protein [Pseudomonadota bacterium]
PVDTGFIVYNSRNYPNLTALFAHLGVATKNTEMSFGASLDYGKFEYSGTDLNGILGQRLNALRPRFWRMIFGILTFYRNAAKIIDDPAYEGMTLGEYLTRHDYSKSFINDHLLPMGAAIWSTTAAEMKAYPVQAFVRFFESHGLLS